MEAIADIVRAYPNLIVISDEVYKFSVYNPLEHGDSTSIGHYHFARLPGLTHPTNNVYWYTLSILTIITFYQHWLLTHPSRTSCYYTTRDNFY